MAIRVKQVGEIRGIRILLSDRHHDVASLLTNLEPLAGRGDEEIVACELPIVIGDGAAARSVLIALSPFLTAKMFEAAKVEPFFIERNGDAPKDIPFLALFRGKLFAPERDLLHAEEREEVALRVKKAVYAEENEMNSLKSYVANMEAATKFREDGPRREAIPDDVKLVVWSRDGGACVLCGSKDKLHFDHIIPFAKGGSDIAENIQILCEPCNLRKSDKIAF